MSERVAEDVAGAGEGCGYEDSVGETDAFGWRREEGRGEGGAEVEGGLNGDGGFGGWREIEGGEAGEEGAEEVAF